MQVSIRFLTFSAKTPKGYCPLSLPDGATGAELLQIVDDAGKAGAFCAASDWAGLPEYVLLASGGRMLPENEPLAEGMQISIIGQMIGG
ncbi:MAG TPA: hypothetical protein VN538_02575 [Clostridia bacterium]|jgi:hypothetical protein|nr:hypothetical protein [Clostridia bacterium]